MRVFLLSLLVAHAFGSCEEWCVEQCADLNGDVTLECNDCQSGTVHRCFPGAEGYGRPWEVGRDNQQRKYLTSVNADGTVTEVHDPDAPIERSHKAVVYAELYYAIASRHRSEDGAIRGEAANLTDFEEYPLPVPQDVTRHCEVHSCVLIDGDQPCAKGRAECAGPRGHLRPIGEQFETLHAIEEHDVRVQALNATSFYRRAVRRVRPLVLRGGAAATTDLDRWTDESLRQQCKLEGGAPWHVLVEKQNRITQNDRNPLMHGWEFCQFLDEYAKPEYKNMLYCVNAISDEGNQLQRLMSLPDVLACDELYTALHDARLWMSRGNTTSSLHFDTHENLLLQIDGAKDVYLWHPNETSNFYMDFHDKFGLSPVNVDRVDLERFPRVANATTYHVRLEAGDAVYIPDSWWHVVVSHQRNIAIAMEVALYAGEAGEWPAEVRARKNAKGVFWAEQTRIDAAMRERFAITIPSRTTRRPIKCEEPLKERPNSLADIPWLGDEPQY